MAKITPVILCGGSGIRLWPLSRKSHPKQFVPILGPHTPFQEAALRLTGEGFAPPMVVTHSDFRFVVTEQMAAVGVDPGPILIEAAGRNTAPAILAATLTALAEDPDAVLLVAPSDHRIADPGAFGRAAEAGLAAVAEGRMATFGIPPSRPETDFGYLELAEAPTEDPAPVPLLRFVEKPDAARAAQMLAEGRYLWNSGIFLFAARDMLAAFEAHAPALLAPVREAVEGARADLGFLRLAPEPWEGLDSISIDYAVMEKLDTLSVVPFAAPWADLGSWDAVRRAMTPDADGVTAAGPVTAIDCRNVLLRAEDSGQELVGIGLEDLVVIAMDDAVLVADPSRTEAVREAVATLKARGAGQAEAFAMDHRPWGHFETLVLDDRFQVKRIVVKPGGKLSLQSHHHRAEHWIVVMGTAKVTIGETEQLVSENQSVYIPLGEKHRMENPGKMPMVLIEVQTGGYLGEDDIIRYDDVYARGEGAKG
ncbi:MAG: mannose-1-phosphate guanylyltransferase/mannose-6-phosphate isomerase [Pseudomonadota bacterium]